jgi:glutamate--cysteine ligase
LLAALFAREHTVDAALELTRPVAHHWLVAARDGLADPGLAAVAPRLTELACEALPGIGLSPAATSDLTHRLRTKAGGDHV